MGEAGDPVERETASQPKEILSRYFFLGMGLLCLAIGGSGLAYCVSEAIAESRLALGPPIPVVGTVIETRIVGTGKRSRKEALVEYTIDDRSHRQWLRLIRSYSFCILTGLLVLCVKAIGSNPQMAHNTGRHVLISSGLAVALIAIVMSLAALGFGFR